MTASCLFFPRAENLNNALGAIRVLGLELLEEELKPHLNTVLISIRERSRSTRTRIRGGGLFLSVPLESRTENWSVRVIESKQEVPASP